MFGVTLKSWANDNGTESIQNEAAAESDSDPEMYEPDPPAASSSSSAQYVTRDVPADYSQVPALNDEKPYFGPRNNNGHIKVIYPSKVDGYMVDGEKAQEMEALGLPSGFTFGHTGREKGKKGDKKTFYCNICLIQLNSEDTMQSHCKGVRHMKKVRSVVAEGEAKNEPVDQRGFVIPINNPEPTRRKVPVRLHEKIRETKDPVIGLRFVKEFIAVSDPEMEPFYKCTLCGNQGISNGMFSHIMGLKHRQAFIEKYHDNDPSSLDWSQSRCLQFANKHAENGEKLSDLIVTRHSDEDYPWPPGKAPWCIEQGGTGVPPDGSRENYGKNNYKCSPKHETDVDSKMNVKQGTLLPNPSSVPPPQNREETLGYLELASKLISLAGAQRDCFSMAEELSITSLTSSLLERVSRKNNRLDAVQEPVAGPSGLQNTNGTARAPVKREREDDDGPPPAGDKRYRGGGPRSPPDNWRNSPDNSSSSSRFDRDAHRPRDSPTYREVHRHRDSPQHDGGRAVYERSTYSPAGNNGIRSPGRREKSPVVHRNSPRYRSRSPGHNGASPRWDHRGGRPRSRDRWEREGSRGRMRRSPSPETRRGHASNAHHRAVGRYDN